MKVADRAAMPLTTAGEAAWLVRNQWLHLFDGDGWQPVARMPQQIGGFVSMATDAARGLFVATHNSATAVTTFVLSGGQWSAIGPGPISPQAKLVFDPATASVLAWWDGPGTTLDHVFDGARWNALPAGTRPYGVRAIAPDPVRRRLVGVGLRNTASAGQTWEWDGSSWTQRMPSTPPPETSSPRISFDPVTQRVLLLAPAGAAFETWLWDGTNWTLADTSMGFSTSPVLDRHRGQLTQPSSGPYQTARAWDGTTWVTYHSLPTDDASYMVEDPVRRVLVAHTLPWVAEFDGARWTTIPTPYRPTQPMPLAYDITAPAPCCSTAHSTGPGTVDRGHRTCPPSAHPRAAGTRS